MLKTLITPTTKRLLVNCGMAGVVGLIGITWLQIKPLGFLFLVIFIFWFHKTEFRAQIIPPDELRIKVIAFFDRITRMRETNPTFFCTVASAYLGSMAILGNFLSGSNVTLICLIIAVLLSTKYNFKILTLKQTNFNWSAEIQENEIDDFLPEVNETNMCVLDRASDQSNTSFATEDVEEKSEEIPSELLIPDCIPEIDENSTDEDEALGIGIPDEVNQRASTFSAIEFKKSHFKKGSSVSTSSSDEENLLKGLKFPEYLNIGHGSQLDKFEENMSGSIACNHPQAQSMIIPNSYLPNLVSGLVSWASMTSNNRISGTLSLATTNRTAISDEEESDFEIVNTEEYQ